mmetsp:Transcript_12997/g.22227  ORF Transcript_12997/g.22227 Transcript_12997/m.22227 type:complete len:256 (-) Transcript_12997:448-1215(-)
MAAAFSAALRAELTSFCPLLMASCCSLIVADSSSRLPHCVGFQKAVLSNSACALAFASSAAERDCSALRSARSVAVASARACSAAAFPGWTMLCACACASASTASASARAWRSDCAAASLAADRIRSLSAIPLARTSSALGPSGDSAAFGASLARSGSATGFTASSTAGGGTLASGSGAGAVDGIDGMSGRSGRSGMPGKSGICSLGMENAGIPGSLGCSVTAPTPALASSFAAALALAASALAAAASALAAALA